MKSPLITYPIALLVLVLTLVSCKKSGDKPNGSFLIGKWKFEKAVSAETESRTILGYPNSINALDSTYNQGTSGYNPSAYYGGSATIYDFHSDGVLEISSSDLYSLPELSNWSVGPDGRLNVSYANYKTVWIVKKLNLIELVLESAPSQSVMVKYSFRRIR